MLELTSDLWPVCNYEIYDNFIKEWEKREWYLIDEDKYLPVRSIPFKSVMSSNKDS